MKNTDLKNTIEEVTLHLDEVGDPLLKEANAIHDTLKWLNHLKQQTEDSIRTLAKQRQDLFTKIQKNYVNSEIETADVSTTRAKDL